VFAAHHHPPYSEIWEEAVQAQIRRHLIPLYESAGVDVNFHGHIHDYERGEFVPPETGRRIWQVQTSGGGGLLWWDEFDGEWDQIDLVIMDEYHYCVVDVGATELTLRAINDDGVQIDEFTIPAEPRDGQPPADPNEPDPAGPSQWDFSAGDVASSYGPGTLEYFDGPDGATAAQTVFGTTTALGLPAIDGQPAHVMGFPKATDSSMGFRVRHGAPPNGGGIYVNEYTLVFDLLVPQSTFADEDWLPFHNTNCCNENDADVFVRVSDGAIGIGGVYHGEVRPDTWHRVALVFDLTTEIELVKYIDGEEVGRQFLGGIDGRWSIYTRYDAWPWFFLFTDDSGDAAPGYVSSVYFTVCAMTADEIAALGAADADGILPPPCVADINGDGAVDLSDLAELLAHYRTASGASYADGDVDGDGDVDLSDLAAMLAEYGQDCP
jgi:hypothetical protein